MVNKPAATSFKEQDLTSWGQVSAYLQEVERKELWRPTARTLTEWARAYAERRGCTVTLLWRYKSAGRFYNERRAALGSQGVQLPRLDQTSTAVSAEAVELLAKVMRVAPVDVVSSIEVPTLRGEIQKKDVRAIWDAYAPLLEGKTARGRGVSAPHRALDLASRAEADVLLGLKLSSGHWLPESPAMFEIYPEEEVVFEARGIGYRCDALMVSRADKNANVLIHGVDIRGLSPRLTIEQPAIDWAEKSVDYFWIACTGAPAPADVRRIRNEIGILQVEPSGSVTVIRKAERWTHNRTAGEQLARDLLARSLRWWK